MKYAIMTVDPGKTTGTAFGLFNMERARTIEGLMRRAIRKKALIVGQIAMPEGADEQFWNVRQGALLFREWLKFKQLAFDYGVPIPNILLVIEDFQLRQRSADLSPVEVTNAFLAHLAGVSNTWAAMSLGTQGIIFQSASEAKTYATDERIRRWGLWTVGKEHGRDATRHLALRASKLLK